MTNTHAASVQAGHPLWPVLLVRGDAPTGRPPQIADGYDRVCASHTVEENTDVSVRTVDLPPRS